MSTTPDYVNIANWSKDHWSTLAYIETVMVECGGFQIGLDCRMRSNRRNFRVMHEQCPRPKRAKQDGTRAVCMDPKYTSRVKNSTTVDHDDWCCIQDMAVAELFTVGVEQIQPGVVLHLSEAGKAMIAALRAHKATGGQFAAFVPPHAEITVATL